MVCMEEINSIRKHCDGGAKDKGCGCGIVIKSRGQRSVVHELQDCTSVVHTLCDAGRDQRLGIVAAN